MLQDYQLLRIPGPTPIPPSVQLAMAQPMIGHRSKEAQEMIAQLRPQLCDLFGTKQEVAILAGSGTAGLEMAVVNSVEPGDEVIVMVTGVFGDRFAQICEAHGIIPHRVMTEWGKAFTSAEVKQALTDFPNAKALFATQTETSTGVLNPIHQLAELTRPIKPELLLIVDGVSAIGAVEMQMDLWDLDFVVTGSQKALMLPAGLAFVAASHRALQHVEKNNHKGFYFDFSKYLKNNVVNSSPFTPAVSLLVGLSKSLELLQKEGFSEVYRRHLLMMKMTRAAMHALHLPLFTSDEDASPTATSVLPETFDAEQLRKILKEEFNLIIAGGQQHLKGKLFRIGHMGYCSPQDILQIISIIELALAKLNVKIELGAGVKAAQEVYLKGENA